MKKYIILIICILCVQHHTNAQLIKTTPARKPITAMPTNAISKLVGECSTPQTVAVLNNINSGSYYENIVIACCNSEQNKPYADAGSRLIKTWLITNKATFTVSFKFKQGYKPESASYKFQENLITIKAGETKQFKTIENLGYTNYNSSDDHNLNYIIINQL
ncbi:hypothetical protein ACFOWM_03230 [Ferruginibacter yonginensis]|uniref:Secreted protein n=1 Tax=Ferruginibacter yonginensis TaxID=1310416 RepID=A0ABV8QQA9_9BACT